MDFIIARNIDCNYIDINNTSTNSNRILLRITSGEKIPAGSFLTVTGTAVPSNATHTKCNVQLQTNQNGYKLVSPLDPAGTYTNWKGTTSGVNDFIKFFCW